MLNKNITDRYHKFDQIANHIWFKDFSFDDLLSLNVKPPYKPKMDDNLGTIKQRPYKDQVKTFKDWEIPEGQPKLSKKMKDDFYTWLDKF